MWDKEPYSNRGETDAKGPDAEGGKFQKSQERDREEARAEVGPGGRTNPFWDPFGTPLT
jgi:hypothetical protein